MRIGIFSKLGCSGGSEHRCAVLAGALADHSSHPTISLLCEDSLNPIIRSTVNPLVTIYEHVFQPEPINLNRLYEVDVLLIVNSDSYSFTRLDYWEGRSERHPYYVDISNIPQMVFLFNFGISQARHLTTLLDKCQDVRIACANRQYYDELSTDRFIGVCRLPRIVLYSPIGWFARKMGGHGGRVRIGRHSKAYGYKFDDDNLVVIRAINDQFGGLVEWDFMGVPFGSLTGLAEFRNVTVRKEYSIDVGEYLAGLDIFLFLIEWGRDEPWARVVAEAMSAGLPVVATARGGKQVVDGNTGFLCGSVKEVVARLGELIVDRGLSGVMGRNARIVSQAYRSQRVAAEFIDFVSV